MRSMAVRHGRPNLIDVVGVCAGWPTTLSSTVAPGFVMPSLTGYTDEGSRALLLMRFQVPCWAIAHVFGRDAMYWYRLGQRLGRFRVVGTPVQEAARLPKDLVADERHRWLGGVRVYSATHRWPRWPMGGVPRKPGMWSRRMSPPAATPRGGKPRREPGQPGSLVLVCSDAFCRRF